MRIHISLFWVTLFFCSQIAAETYDTNNVSVQTFAGSGFYGHHDGQGTQTMFNYPSAIVTDSTGNFFVADNSNYRIRKITPSGAVTTFLGGGQSSLPGYGTNVSLQNYSFNGMTMDRSNILWVATYSGLLRIAQDGLAQIVSLNGLNSSGGVCVDSQNNLYIGDTSGNRIYRLLTNGVLEVFAGSGNQGAVNGNGIFTSFHGPGALAVDTADNIYVSDLYNNLIRKINQNRDVVTIAGKLGVSINEDGNGTNACFAGISGMICDNAGNIFLSSTTSSYNLSGSSVRRMAADATVTTIAGDFSQTGFVNGTGINARFNGSSGLCISQGMIFVADSINQRIRTISFNSIPQPVSGANLVLNSYPGLKIVGITGRTYRIESSIDMSNWISEQTILLTRSPYLWIDENSVAGKKFYRAFLLP